MNFIESVRANQNYFNQIRALQRSLAFLESFQFTRYSDGELFMILEKEIRLTTSGAWIDGVQINSQRYADHDCKIFKPSEDKALALELIKALCCKVKSYVIGLPLPCCVGDDMFTSMVKKTGLYPSFYSTANLLINDNYPFFLGRIIPILQKRNVLLVANKRANAEFFNRVCGHIKLGDDAKSSISRYEDEISRFLDSHSYEYQSELVILFAASYLSNLLIYRLVLRYPHVTMIDIGSALHPQLNLGLIRHYLQLYYSDPTSYCYHKCSPRLPCS